jgi:hypothetical protein
VAVKVERVMEAAQDATQTATKRLRVERHRDPRR